MRAAMDDLHTADGTDVSIVLTCHREGLIAHATLLSIQRSREWAHSKGLKTELIVTLDLADEETRRVVQAFPNRVGRNLVVELDVGDLGASRNAAIARATGRYVAICDGDDYYAQNWFADCVAMSQVHPGSVLHPELVVLFDQWKAHSWQRDQGHPDFDPDCLLTINPWNSCCFALREVFLAHPYLTLRPGETGFGFEDWHWNCETLAAGHEHRVVPRTVHFVRRKRAGSLNLAHASTHALIPPSTLFGAA